MDHLNYLDMLKFPAQWFQHQDLYNYLQLLHLYQQSFLINQEYVERHTADEMPCGVSMTNETKKKKNPSFPLYDPAIARYLLSTPGSVIENGHEKDLWGCPKKTTDV